MGRTVFVVLARSLGSLASLNNLSRPRVLDVVLRLTSQQLPRHALEVLLSTVLLQDRRRGRFLELDLLLEELAVE